MADYSEAVVCLLHDIESAAGSADVVFCLASVFLFCFIKSTNTGKSLNNVSKAFIMAYSFLLAATVSLIGLEMANNSLPKHESQIEYSGHETAEAGEYDYPRIIIQELEDDEGEYPNIIVAGLEDGEGEYPNIIVTGLEDGEVYRTPVHAFTLTIRDDVAIKRLAIYENDKVINSFIVFKDRLYSELNPEENIDYKYGEIVFALKPADDIRILSFEATDVLGRKMKTEEVSVKVTYNFFDRIRDLFS